MASLAFTRLSALAFQHGLSIYDAAYLELAFRKKLPLACKDGPLSLTAQSWRLILQVEAAEGKRKASFNTHPVPGAAATRSAGR